MSNQILIKGSSTPGKIPVPDDLAHGELALNQNDGRLYYKGTDNAVRALNDGALRREGNQTLDGELTITGGLTLGAADTLEANIRIEQDLDLRATLFEATVDMVVENPNAGAVLHAPGGLAYRMGLNSARELTMEAVLGAIAGERVATLLDTPALLSERQCAAIEAWVRREIDAGRWDLISRFYVYGFNLLGANVVCLRTGLIGTTTGTPGVRPEGLLGNGSATFRPDTAATPALAGYGPLDCHLAALVLRRPTGDANIAGQLQGASRFLLDVESDTYRFLTTDAAAQMPSLPLTGPAALVGVAGSATSRHLASLTISGYAEDQKVTSASQSFVAHPPYALAAVQGDGTAVGSSDVRLGFYGFGREIVDRQAYLESGIRIWEDLTDWSFEGWQLLEKVKASGAPVVDSQVRAVNRFYRRVRGTPGWAAIRRLYFPLWRNDGANAICLKTLTSGTFEGTTMTFLPGGLQALSTCWFDMGVSPESQGLTNTSAWLGGLLFNGQANFSVCGSYDTNATICILATASGGDIRSDLGSISTSTGRFATPSITSVRGVVSVTRLDGETRNFQRRRDGRWCLGERQVDLSGPIGTSNMFAMAHRDASGNALGGGSMGVGAYWMGVGVEDQVDADFTAALADLWTEFSGEELEQ